ncbi:YceI family protein [Olivibacter sitiensis]|uniref:YceI family protein n=1 Tax=Olivibacter sitiensis TaxID=376470 RepID=UPI000486B19F|nr:YceI family protein [Olivibacter sitiensis]
MSQFLWSTDAHHSNIIFHVKHMLISTATGQFKSFSIKASTEDDDFDGTHINAIIAADSVSTNEVYRDEHLKSEAFFASKDYPNILFTSTQFTRKDKDTFQLNGKLTIKDVTKELTFPVQYIGLIAYNDHMRAAFEANFTISRKAFNLTYSPLMETGGMVLADEVSVRAHISLVRQL